MTKNQKLKQQREDFTNWCRRRIIENKKFKHVLKYALDVNGFEKVPKIPDDKFLSFRASMYNYWWSYTRNTSESIVLWHKRLNGQAEPKDSPQLSHPRECPECGTGLDKKGEREWKCEPCGHIWVDPPIREAQEAQEAQDMVNHPPHYTTGEIECIDAIRAALTPEEFRGYCKGVGMKYIWRERHKGGDQSLEKGVWYLEEAAGKHTKT